jgi:hypothetical protein
MGIFIVGKARSHEAERCFRLLGTLVNDKCNYSQLRARAIFVSVKVDHNRDAAWQFPTLRMLLPAHPGIISPDGAVAYDDFTRTNS